MISRLIKSIKNKFKPSNGLLVEEISKLIATFVNSANQDSSTISVLTSKLKDLSDCVVAMSQLNNNLNGMMASMASNELSFLHELMESVDVNTKGLIEDLAHKHLAHQHQEFLAELHQC